MLSRLILIMLLAATPALAAEVRVPGQVKCDSAQQPKPEARERAAILLNQYRQKKGLRTVSLDAALDAAAHAHARDQAENGHMSHVGSDGSDFVARAERANFDGLPRAENVAWNFASVESVMAAWHRSPGHYANMMLDDITHVGIGAACSENGPYWAMVLGRRDGGIETAFLQ
jgi:uncharacterized protein YkwD